MSLGTRTRTRTKANTNTDTRTETDTKPKAGTKIETGAKMTEAVNSETAPKAEKVSVWSRLRTNELLRHVRTN